MKKMKKGFTIVELVIVIGVIAILSAILIPTFVNLTEKANKSAAKQDVANCYTQYVVAYEDEGKSPKAINKVEVVRTEGESNVSYYYVDGEWTNEAPSGVARADETADYTVGTSLTLYELA